MIGRDVYNVLHAKGVHTLHHANSVTTSCTFLQVRGLASRGYVEGRQLTQTPQYSDDMDKRLGIWRHVFTDGVDIHARGSIRNNYGPVLFMLPLAVLQQLPLGTDVLVTRKNPVHWQTGESSADRYFMSAQELHDGCHYGEFGQHVVLRNQDGFLPFSMAALRLLLDDPQRALSAGADPYSHAVERLPSAARDGGLAVHITKRQCNPACRRLLGHKWSYDGQDVDFWF